jgi:membrane protease YdiL (CAAX protease family)
MIVIGVLVVARGIQTRLRERARRRTQAPHAVTRAVRRHPLAAFFIWFFTVGQAFAFAPLILGAQGFDVTVQPFILGSTLVGLLLPALVITRIVDGPRGLRDLWRRAVDTRVSAAWYALAVVGVPLLAVAITVAVLGPPTAGAGDVAGLLLPGLLLPLALTFLPNNWWEEVAWMGFVQARLQERRGPVVAAVLTGVMFALQHISLVVRGDLVSAIVLMTLTLVLVIPFRFLTAWVYNRTGSLFLVGLLHGMGNAVATGSGFHPGLLAHLYPDQTLAVLAHLVAFLLLGVGVLAATRGRLGRRTMPTGSRADVHTDSSPGRTAGLEAPAVA